MKNKYGIATTAILLTKIAIAQSSSQASCSSTLKADFPAPSMADGYMSRLVANDLTTPRGIKFDKQGALLVVEEGVGISALTLDDSGNGCITSQNRKLVVDEPSLNHGIELSPDGNTLYASSGTTLWSWEYSADSQSNTSEPKALVTGMAGSDHTSRTILLSKWAPGLMVINRGSNSNVDPEAVNLDSGHAQIRAFNVTNATEPYDFNNHGILLGWGLRNDVGIDEEPNQGGIYSVENSADQVMRDGKDIHQNNPAEKMNFLGYLPSPNQTRTSPNQGRNFGYPNCFAAWLPSAIPHFTGQVGQQFTIDTPNSTLNDTSCGEAYHQRPRLGFQAHMAPLDILFNPAGTAAWISFHGSWDRTDPVGYKLSVVSFANGEPVDPMDSTSAAVTVMANQDNSKCPDSCFRPVGLAWDAEGRLFMSSDATGEVYVVMRSDGKATGSVGSNATGTIPGMGASGSGSSSGTSGASAVSFMGASVMGVVFMVLAFVL